MSAGREGRQLGMRSNFEKVLFGFLRSAPCSPPASVLPARLQRMLKSAKRNGSVPTETEIHVKAVSLLHSAFWCVLQKQFAFPATGINTIFQSIPSHTNITFSESLWQQTIFFKCMLDCGRIKFQPIKNLGIFHLSATHLDSAGLHNPGVMS